MNQLTITWDGVYDPTGYLHSFAKSLFCAVKNSPWADLAGDIVATSGFAFRMWVRPDLCPSATSIWEFKKQPEWIACGGLTATYAECLFQPEDISEQCRLTAMPAIRESIARGVPAVAWEIGTPEWGLLTGYDDETEQFSALSIMDTREAFDYRQLGKGEIPMLNVVTVTGRNGKTQEEIVADTRRLAKAHLLGEEWCEDPQVQGLACYPVFIGFFENSDLQYATCWEMEYALGTFAALKWYAWKFFEKHCPGKLAALYQTVYDCWQKAFDLKKTADMSIEENRRAVTSLLKQAEACEQEAVTLL